MRMLQRISCQSSHLSDTEPFTLYICSPSWERWVEECYLAEVGRQVEEEMWLDINRELELYPFEEAEIEYVEIELLPEVQR